MFDNSHLMLIYFKNKKNKNKEKIIEYYTIYKSNTYFEGKSLLYRTNRLN